MYQGYVSDEKSIDCVCGVKRTYKESYIGYAGNALFTDSNVCPQCKKRWSVGQLQQHRTNINWRKQNG